QPLRAFPVFLNLQREQPRSLGHLRYLLILRLRQAVARWEQARFPEPLQAYRAFLKYVADVKVAIDFMVKLEVRLNPQASPDEQTLGDEAFVLALVRTIEDLRTARFEGLCFLIDEAEYVISQPWSDDAWSYFRSLKDTEPALKPFLGIVISGHRDLKQYRHRVRC